MAARSFVLAPLRASRQCPRLYNGTAAPSLGNGAAVRERWSGLRVEFRGSSIFTLASPSNSLRSKSLNNNGCVTLRLTSHWRQSLGPQRRWHATDKPSDQTDAQKSQTGSKKSPILSRIPLPTSHENIYTIPNILTMTRLVAAPLVGYFLVHDYHQAALALFAYAGITDLVDGYIARRYNLQTVVGTIIDPMADKLLMTIGVACLAVNGSIPVWLAVIILGRDVGLAISAIYYRWISLPPPKTMARYWDFSLPSAEVKPTTISKVNTALQLLLVVIISSYCLSPPFTLPILRALQGNSMSGYLVAATTIWSGMSYVFSRDAVKILTKEEVQKRLARASAKKSN
ncbi:CDP-alcohol phosphatidyltransferase-domain-containing protein [Aspergillus pseudotamarii]|uniref:CDP-alcohol phosphatidyltransferase-domain-containing protein n=1 Tax=Aspergillus pseudotamarii TaxID=132259 RepID=A0A5N6T7F2_ASPPS|nr:CDP-alcohol phosphatidyltransferase-domain-containing protein [Aspergillus pseudotamarii]KAE8142139.1 CDP-alcohol phosphatidyltransferase-domain-containing protein [Aspergillus pseudotamarii]